MQCRILALPAELRIAIFEHALIEHPYIRVTAQLRPPALLSVCKQVREEGLSIWYGENLFAMPIVDCDARLAIAFQVHHQSLALGEIRGAFEIYGEPNWQNLFRWCTAIYSGASAGLEKGARLGPLGKVIAAANEIAARFTENAASWDACEEVLENLRFAVGGLEPMWLE